MSAPKSPRFIFLESTALFQLGPRFENVDFEKLIELKDSAGFRLLVSEISWQEYIRNRKKEISVFIDSCAKVERLLERHEMSIAEIPLARSEAADYLSAIDSHFRQRATKRGIEIVPMASVDLARLLRMSINCVPPFEEAEDKSKEKGFRDSLIMFSILESLRGRSTELAIVVTDDQLLAEAFQSHAAEFESDLMVVRTIDEATEYVGTTIVESERLRLKKESAEAAQMLAQFKDTIAGQVSEIRELTESDLGQTRIGMLFGTPTESLDIRGIQSIKLDRVDSAIWKDRDRTASRILFRCLCEATVMVPAPYRGTMFDEPRKFRVGESPRNMFFTATLGGYGATEQRELPFHVYGTADFEKIESDWKLLRMRIDKSLPPEEEYYALEAAEISQTEQ
jgi:PIN domain